jgi:hypothetical protein
MSRESLIPPTIIASVCLAGAVALGAAAKSQFEEANIWEAARDKVAADIAAQQHLGTDYTSPPGNPTPEDLQYQYNTAAGSAFGENALGWGAVAISGVFGAGVLGNGWSMVTVVRRRRED